MARNCGGGWWPVGSGRQTSCGARGVSSAERRAVRSVEEQQARVSAAAVAPRPVSCCHRRGPGADVRRRSRHRTSAARFRPGRHRRLRGPQRRRLIVGESGPYSDQNGDDHLRAVSGEANESRSAPGGVTLPVMGVIEAGARTPSRLQPRQAARVQTGAPTADAGRRGAAVAMDRRRAVAGAGAARGAIGCLRAPHRRRRSARRRRGAGRARSSVPRRSGCWPRSAVSGSWSTRGRGCR